MKMKVDYYDYHTPIGWLSIGCCQNKIVSCLFGKLSSKIIKCETDYHKKAFSQLEEYFAGKRKEFELEYEYIKGSDFQHQVWNALLDIPYGQTASYKDIAIQINSPKAYRAVGHANNQNQIVLFIPCHRVIGSNGNLVGYAGGLEKKEYLLELEKRNR